LQIVAADDGDDVTRLQQQVVGGVFLNDCFAEVERDEFGAQIDLVQALDDGVIPVDLVEQVFDLGQRCGRLFAGSVVAATAALGIGAEFILR
jgi:hypothetical protein